MGDRDEAQPGIGDRLRHARGRVGLSREELAVRSGVSWSGIAQVEAGRRLNVRPGTLSALATALGVSVDYLVNGSGAAPRMLEHRALLYETEQEFMDFAVPFATAGTERDEPVLFMAGSSKTRSLRKALGRRAKQVDWMSGSDLFATPADALSTVRSYVSEKAEEGAVWMRVFGEPLWTGRSAAAVRGWCMYESMINASLAGAPATIVCAYNVKATSRSIVGKARATHPETITGGHVEASAEYADPGAFVLGGSVA